MAILQQQVAQAIDEKNIDLAVSLSSNRSQGELSLLGEGAILRFSF